MRAKIMVSSCWTQTTAIYLFMLMTSRRWASRRSSWGVRASNTNRRLECVTLVRDQVRHPGSRLLSWSTWGSTTRVEKQLTWSFLWKIEKNKQFNSDSMSDIPYNLEVIQKSKLFQKFVENETAPPPPARPKILSRNQTVPEQLEQSKVNFNPSFEPSFPD